LVSLSPVLGVNGVFALGFGVVVDGVTGVAGAAALFLGVTDLPRLVERRGGWTL